MKNMLKLMNMTCRSAISQIILLFLCVDVYKRQVIELAPFFVFIGFPN